MTALWFGWIECTLDIIQKLLLPIQKLSVFLLLHHWHSPLKITSCRLNSLLFLWRLLFQVLRTSLVKPVQALRLTHRFHREVEWVRTLKCFHFFLFLFRLVDAWRLDLFLDCRRRIVELVRIWMYFDPTFLIQHVNVYIILLFGYLSDSSKQKQVIWLLMPNQCGSFSFLYKDIRTSGQVIF